MTNPIPGEFANPGSAYRGKPFWAWNGRLAPEELRRQVRIMHRMGLGGFFMHSRVGLATEYLSKEWFDCVRACVDEAESLGMEAWLYDEDRWPSGAAGGWVTRNPKYRSKVLSLHLEQNATSLTWDKSTLAAAVATLKGNEAYNVRNIPRGKRPGRMAKGEMLLIYRLVSMPTSDWYNGQSYLDTLNHDAVREFIDVTHEAYLREVGGEFGKVIPGIFTDEPHHNWMLTQCQWSNMDTGGNLSVPWTEAFPAIFRRRYGYDLLSDITKVFYDVDGERMHRERYHYHDCLTFLFCDAFARQIGQWCEKHNLLFTGHTLEEPKLSTQVGVSATLRFYEHMQVPGMDLLCETWREYDTARQVSSVARQFGRRWRLTETYGCTGWDFPFVGHKALGDWQVALGINLRCQHLSWYTMEGQAKRDYPASIFYQSPWWESYGWVEDYFARIHAVMTRGQEVRDLLVIHPLESMWMQFSVGWQENPKIRTYDEMMVRLRDSLLAANLDFDYGDEDILARHGKVGRKEKKLKVNRAEYKAVLVPPLLTIRRSTLMLLKRFSDAGGTVIFAGSAPSYVDAVRSEEAMSFASQCLSVPAKGAKLSAAVASSCRRIHIQDSEGNEIRQTLHLLREDKDAFYLFVCNVGYDYARPRPGDATRNEPRISDRTDTFPDVFILGFDECQGRPVELDPGTGETRQTDAKRSGEQWRIRTSLTKLGSRMFMIPKCRGRSVSAGAPLKDVRIQTLRQERWEYSLSESNNLVLDCPRYRIGRGRWCRADEILRIDQRVRKTIGCKPRGGQMVQPWAQSQTVRCKPTTVELAYSFDVQTLPVGELFLALERPELYDVQINDQSVDANAECGWWVDRSLRKLPVDPACLHTGTNDVHLRCRYDAKHPGLEILYLLGNFGVTVRGAHVAMTALPETLKPGDWTKQGLAFYSGSVAYRRTFQSKRRKHERLIVHVPEYRGVGVRVFVNGQSAGVIGWEPNEVDITEFVQPGKNELAIEILGHRRNSHGPLHIASRPIWTGPEEFLTTGKDWKDEYQLVSCGMTAAPQLITRR